MRAVSRRVVALLALLALTISLTVAPAPPAAASDADLEFQTCAAQAGLGNGECQHFLRNPSAPTDDPCWCDKCRNGATGQHHDGKTVPFGWNATLFESGGLECYLKRHALAFGITCSECLTNDKPWPDGGAGNIGTVPEKDFAGRPSKQTVLARLEAEKHLFKKPDDAVLAYNRHFYVVTDVGGLKVRTPGGSARIVTRHEWVHLMIERAEFARREWVRNLGEPIVMRVNTQRPIAIYLTERYRDFERVGTEYFRQPGSRGLKGPVAELCDKMCLTGITFSREEAGDDHQMIVHLRHEIAHAMLSMWGSLETRPKSLPIWMDEGLAHWLTKSIDSCRNDVFYCTGEGLGGPSGGGGGPAWPGKDWEKDIVRYVQTNKLTPIEELLGKTVINELTEEDQKRAWSYCEVGLAEMRVPFAKMLAALRKEKNPREAFTENLGCSPETFDERWRERVAGRRKSMTATEADGAAEASDAPGARDRKAIAAEQDPKKLAYKIRQLGEIKDPKTIAVVVDVIAQDLDLPRETALVTLLAVKDASCRETIWSYGLAHPDGMVRAYVARVCGRLKLDAALPKLEAQLDDKNWYARAEAAVACGTLKDAKALPGLRKMVGGDPSEKARVGAMDALAMFKDDAENAVGVVAKLLDSSQWQLRIASAQTLGEIGSMEGVEPLVARLEKEPTGRIADDLTAGLPRRPDAGNEKPSKPGPDPNDPHATHDGGPEPYFGVELYSNRVAFVCDTSESMLELFTPDPAASKTLNKEYVGTNKLQICKEQVAHALEGLNPRAHFNIITFGTQIRSLSANPVPASAGNIDKGKGFLQSLGASGETNYYDALKAALDLGAAPDTNPDFKSTPDTITFLTDGQPTKGDILDADVILEWYTGLNRYARVKTHTITLGVINVDIPLLRGMAERNGGKFTIVPEKKAGAK
ncbi:MAG: HEAT repeat domain-containing protein [Planctomycetes bacterium]|nr:HEAT repeat domain-containing protein [Planctomycetota bacterium]